MFFSIWEKQGNTGTKANEKTTENNIILKAKFLESSRLLIPIQHHAKVKWMMSPLLTKAKEKVAGQNG